MLVTRTFKLVRHEDATGISGTGHIADGAQFSDGTCVLRWKTGHRSTCVYDSLESLIAIHGHGGKTRVTWLGNYGRGMLDAMQDQCECAPLGSVGAKVQGEDVPREKWVAPAYINGGHDEREEWLAGYEAFYADRAAGQGAS